MSEPEIPFDAETWGTPIEHEPEHIPEVPPEWSAPLHQHVSRLAACVRAGEMSKARAVDGLLDFWKLTRVSALGLLNDATRREG